MLLGLVCSTRAGGVQRLLRVTRLPIGNHQQLQRVFLHHAAGIALQEGLQRLRLLRRILLLDGVDIGVIFRRILDFFLLLTARPAPLAAGWPRCLRDRLLDQRRTGEHQQHHDERLLHSVGSSILENLTIGPNALPARAVLRDRLPRVWPTVYRKQMQESGL